ncbi:MAG: MGMT family protein [Enterobacteriaceae bacterium]
MDPLSAPLSQRVYTVVAAIPPGKVLTYGNVAQLAGSPRAARQIGRLLSRLPAGSTLPWHRVINHQGRISLTGESYQKQLTLLKQEGICFDTTERIDLKRYSWQP